MAWFSKPKKKLQADRRELPADVLRSAPSAGIHHQARLVQNFNVCPSCGFHLRIGARTTSGCSSTRREEFDTDLRSGDPLEFVDQPTRSGSGQRSESRDT